MKIFYLAVLLFVFLVISGCTQTLPKEDAIKIAESNGVGKVDGRIFTVAESSYNTIYNETIWIVKKTFVWNTACNFGEEYSINQNGQIFSATRFDDCNDFNKTIQDFTNSLSCNWASCSN